MKKNGYLLSELIISFSLSFVILLVIFNTTINLNQRLSDLFVENKAYSQRLIFNRKIGSDFANKEIKDIKTVNTDSNKKIFTITYEDNTQKNLIIFNDNNSSYIEYSNEKINIPSDMKIDINKVIIEAKTLDEDNMQLIKLKVPIKYSREKKDYGIELYNLTNSVTIS